MDVTAVRLFVMAAAGWLADERQAGVAYLIEENRILRARLRGRIRLTDEEPRRLAVYGHRWAVVGSVRSRRSSHPTRFSGGTEN